MLSEEMTQRVSELREVDCSVIDNIMNPPVFHLTDKYPTPYLVISPFLSSSLPPSPSPSPSFSCFPSTSTTPSSTPFSFHIPFCLFFLPPSLPFLPP